MTTRKTKSESQANPPLLLYIDFRVGGASLGVERKIRGQMEAFRELGFEVVRIAVVPSRMIQAYSAIVQRLRGAERPVLYVRNKTVFSIALLPLLLVLRRPTTFLEIPTPLRSLAREIKISSYPRWVLFSTLGVLRLGVPRVLPWFDFIVEVEPDTSAFMRFVAENKRLRIPNGIDVSVIGTVSQRPVDMRNDVVRIVSAAHFSPWHGIDRLLLGLRDFYQSASSKTSVFVDLIGDGPALCNLQNLAERSGVASYVNFHGALGDESITRVYESSDIGIGPLGSHRRKLTSTSSLKNREYCAMGIPFVQSSTDPDFGGTVPFVLQVPATEEPVDIEAILNFYFTLSRDIPDFRRRMHDYALENLDWKVKLSVVREKALAV